MDLHAERDPLEKVKTVKRFLAEYFPNYEDSDILKMLSRISCHQYGKMKDSLTQDERILYDLLLKHKYSARWVHDLVLLNTLPSDLQTAIKAREISVRNAFKEYTRRKRETPEELYSGIMKDIRELVKTL